MIFTDYPNSSSIKRYSYDDKNHILEVTFPNQITYAYINVPVKDFQRMRRADSTGEFFNDNIVSNYQYTKVSTPPSNIKHSMIL